MTAGFAVVVVATSDQAGHIEGDDLERVAKFLRVSEGVPQFDLEYEGRLYAHCRLGGDAADNSIAFTCDSISRVEAPAGDLNAYYR